MHGLISKVCLLAIAANVCLFTVAYLYNDSGLMWLSIINSALLSTRFLIFKGDKEK